MTGRSKKSKEKITKSNRFDLLNHYLDAGKDDETIVILTGCTVADIQSQRKHFELLKTIKK